MSLVLVAEDDQSVRELVVFQLERDGHRCVAVADGPAALAAAHECVPDLALLDVNMPGMSGFDVCRELRRDPAIGRVPVIMLTASTREADIVTGFDFDVDDYMVKPFKLRELSERVRAVLDRAAGFPIF